MIKLIVCVVAAAFIVIVGFMVLDPQINTTSTSGSITNTLDSNTFSVTVEGEVNKAGTYALKSGSTIYDLITAAGGVKSNADDLAYYEDAEVSKGVTYYIAPKYDNSDVCNASPIEKVNVNDDSQETLQSISGISASIASSIVSYREDNGYFYTLEQLMDVYGIGTATYKKIRNYVILHD